MTPDTPVCACEHKHNRQPHESPASAYRVSTAHNSGTHTPQYGQHGDYGYQPWEDNRHANIGLGLDLGAHMPPSGYMLPSKDLASLLGGIASYERAVGRAFLAQRSYSYPSERSLPSETDGSEHEHAFDPVTTAAVHKSPSLVSLASHSPTSDFYSPNPRYSRSYGPVSHRAGLAGDHHLSEFGESYVAATSPRDMLKNHEANAFPSTPDFGGLLDTFDFEALDRITGTDLLQIRDEDERGLAPGAVEQHSPCNSTVQIPVAASTVVQLHERAISVGLETDVETLAITSRSASPSKSGLPSHRSKAWTLEADERIRQEVEFQKRTGNGSVHWSVVASKVGDRTGVQCQARWAEVLDQNIRKGRWSSEEDRLLRLGNRKFGNSWSKIAEVVQSRTQRQCRSRWLQLNSAVQAIQ